MREVQDDLVVEAAGERAPAHPDEDAGAAAASRGGFLAAAAGITALALLLRLYRLGEAELWLDEAVSAHLAMGRDFLDLLRLEGNASLYYLLLRGWVVMAGTSETALRLPSALAGAAQVAALVWVGRALFGPVVGLCAGLLAALAPLQVYYSQETRTYALVACLLTVVYGALWRALERDRWGWWVVAAAAATAAILAHYLAGLVIVAATPLVLGLGTWRERRRYVLTMGAGALVVLAWLALSMPRAGPHAESSFAAPWLAEAWQQLPPLLAVPSSLEVLALGSQAGRVPMWMRRFNDLVFPEAARWSVVATVGLLACWAAAPWGDGRVGVARVRGKVAYVVGLLLLPLLLLWGLSYLKPAYLLGRYDLVSFPGLMLLVGLGLGKLWAAGRGGRWLAAAATLVLVAGLGWKLALYYRTPGDRTPSARATAAALGAVVESRDLVVFTGRRGVAVRYYLQRLGYRWEGSQCASGDGARRFACVMLPGYPTPVSGQGERVRLVAEAMAGTGTIWLAAGTYRGFDHQVVLVQPEDIQLVSDLRAQGYVPAVASPALGIVLLRRP